MNTKKKLISFTAFIIAIILFPAPAGAFADEDILRAMRDEIARSMKELSIESIQKPYYIEYKITVSNSNDAKASLGGLIAHDYETAAHLSVGVRIGNYKFDNTNFFDFGLSFFGSGDDEETYQNRAIPVEMDYGSLRRELWLATDAAYKEAAEIYTKKVTALQNKIRKDTTHDYLELAPGKFNFKEAFPDFDKKSYENLIVKLSSLFSKYPDIHASQVSYEFNPSIVYYVNSEGREYVKTEFLTGFEVVAASQSDDGMPAAYFYSAYGKIPSDLPNEDSLTKAVGSLIDKLLKVRRASSFDEPYSGPVIFEGQAAAGIFAQVFAPNLVAQREQLTEGGVQEDDQYNAFQSKIGGRVLPEFLSVSAEPNNSIIGSTPLTGHFKLDDEGVPPQDVQLVKDGYLKNLLSSRIPTKRVRTTNGHNRGGAAMLSVIELTSDKKHSKSPKELREKMLKLCKDRELPYGLIVRNIADPNVMYTGIYQITKGDFPMPYGQAKKTLLEVVKVYHDGREELVRGCEGKGISVQSFKDVIFTGNTQYIMNYLAPAVASPFVTGGSRYIGSTVIVPDLLFEDCEAAPYNEDYPKPPFLPNPIGSN